MIYRKIVLYLILSLSGFTTFSQIAIGTNFAIMANLPIDTRMVVANITARDAINPLHRYEGMKVYVLSTGIEYQLRNGITNSDWNTILPSQWITTGNDIYYATGKVGIGATNPSSTLSVGASSQFQVSSTGNLIKINGVATSYPSSQGSAYSYLTNDGSGNLIWENTPLGANYKITPEGGFAIRLKNKSGVTVNKGTVVQASGSDSLAFTRAAAGSIVPIGVVYDNSITDGSECWIVVSGIAEVYFESSVSFGDWAGVSDVNTGQAETTFSAAEHDREIGHAISSRTGAGLAKAVLHFR